MFFLAQKSKNEYGEQIQEAQCKESDLLQQGVQWYVTLLSSLSHDTKVIPEMKE